MTTHGFHGHDSAAVLRPEDGRILAGPPDWTPDRPSPPPWAPGFPECAHTTFVLPISSDLLYLLSRGAHQGGRVELRQAPDRSGDVAVDVRVAYHTPQALTRATVCRLQKGRNGHGIGIFTPLATSWPDPRDQLYFDVVFTFPVESAGSPLRIKEFATQTGNYAHEIGDLWQSMLFDNIALQTSNSPVRAKSITLARGSFTSSNGPITGHFNASDSLRLHTSNANIQASASLFSDGPGATQLELQTSNSPITSSVSLTTLSGSGGDFHVTLRTSNGAVKLRYDDASLGARLVSDVRTSNGPASVVMHPAFEGAFEVSTSNGRPSVRDTHPADPAGAGRHRVLNQTTHGRTVSGTVYWAGAGAGDDDERRGVGSTSTVHSSNASVSLGL